MSADFTPEKEDLKILTPFKMQVLTNFPYIEADFDALTNYQLLCKVVEYLNNVIANENEVTEQVTSLYNAYVSLQNYVNNYFDNLDVQEEINTKIDEMVTDGTLTNLIKGYVDPIYEAYETEINQDISNFKSTVNYQINNMNSDIDIIENKVNSATSGSPKGVYATVTALTTADPDHDYIYIVEDDGKWYYYDTGTTSWVAGGVYQATSFPEVTDIRDSFFSYTYNSAGDSVRGQANILNNKINNLYYENETINYLDPHKIIYGKYMNNITSSPPTEDTASYMMYSMVEIDKPGYYTLKYPVASIGTNNYKIPLYDKDRTFITNLSGTLVGSQDGNNTIVKLNISNEMFYINNCRYIVFNQGLSAQYNNMLVNGETYPESFIDYNAFKFNDNVRLKENQILKNDIRLFNKIFCCGDSLTKGTFNANSSGSTEYVIRQMYSYPTYMTKLFGVTTGNWGIGGYSTKQYYEDIITQTIADDYDSVIIMLGANDLSANNISESRTYYQNLITFFKTKFKKCKIFCCTIIPAYRETNATFYNQFNNDVVKYCVNANTDCYLVDLSMISKCHANSIYAQGHLTAIGYYTLAQEIASEINISINNNLSDYKYMAFADTDYNYIE